MKKITAVCLMAVLALGSAACTNMTKTQQGAVSGAAIGALAGAGISAITGGRGATGAVIGAAVGGLAGTIIGDTEEQKDGRRAVKSENVPSRGYARGHIPSTEK